MKEDPGASRKHVVSRVKARIQAEDTAARLAHTTRLPVQRLTVREFEGHAAQIWATAISTLPEWCFKFALNAVTDTLLHNANLYNWKKLSYRGASSVESTNFLLTFSTPARRPLT